jgi:diphthamide synthase (EF-2-diphthine--ammonia ligase)
MPAWLLPAVKLILPHVGNIVAAAKPVFTKLKGEAADPASVVQRQIAELQAAVSENATHVKELAEQLRITVAALEQGAVEADKQMKRVYRLAWAAAVMAAAALVAAIYALAR